MNVLFLSIAEFDSIYQREIYPDLLREFMKNGHEIYVVSSLEKRNNQETTLINEECCHILKVKVGNITKSGLIEKGIATICIESQFKRAISKYLSDVKFDLILYSTPPITLVNAIKYVKNRDKAITYLLLKDIFPQNALDIGMLSLEGWKGIIYKIFRKKEKQLYAISDYIGCMSQANVNYVIKHNPEVDPKNVEVCPNSIDIVDMRADDVTRAQIRDKYGIPQRKKVLVYGGNLGKPQGIDFLIDCLKKKMQRDDIFYLIVGDGTEYSKIEKFLKTEKPQNVKLMKRLPKEDYDKMIAACDIGMIFLDHRFTIPNFPSRLLAYMQAALPVLACTDKNTDIGQVIESGDFGWWCESNNVDAFNTIITSIDDGCVKQKGANGYSYLKNHYSVAESYSIIKETLKWS